MKTYFISDLHLNHFNILRFEPTRIDATLEYMIKVEKLIIDFTRDDVLEDYNTEDKNLVKTVLKYHDDMLIYKWNKKVKKTDIIWFIGDLGFGNKEYLRECISKLQGIKKMVKGNHDTLPNDFYIDCGFTEVINRKRQIILKDFFVLTHEPAQWMNPVSSPYFYIYGHVHSSPYCLTKTENSRCVCVERQNFEPIEIEEYNMYQESKGD